jgi:hypothetical protein
VYFALFSLLSIGSTCGKNTTKYQLKLCYILTNLHTNSFFYPYAGSIKKYRTLIKGALGKELLAREAAQKDDPNYEKVSSFLINQYIVHM